MKQLNLNEIAQVSGGYVPDEAIIGLSVATSLTGLASLGTAIWLSIDPCVASAVAFATTFGIAIGTGIAFEVVSDQYYYERGYPIVYAF